MLSFQHVTIAGIDKNGAMRHSPESGKAFFTLKALFPPIQLAADRVRASFVEFLRQASYITSMNVLILAPPISRRRVSLFPRHPPVIMATLAAALRERGSLVTAIDAFLEGLSADDAARRVVDNDPDVLVVLPNDVARETPAEVTAQVTRMVRSRADGVTMLAAGVGNEGWMRDLLRAAPALDGALVGDPEETVPAVVMPQVV